MSSVIGAFLSAVVKGLMAFFLPSKDEKLGKLEVENADQDATIKDMEVAKNVSDRVDGMPDADLAGLSDRLNKQAD